MGNKYYARCAPADHSPTDAKRQYDDTMTTATLWRHYGDTMAILWQ